MIADDKLRHRDEGIRFFGRQLPYALFGMTSAPPGVPLAARLLGAAVAAVLALIVGVSGYVILPVVFGVSLLSGLAVEAWYWYGARRLDGVTEERPGVQSEG